jgi:glutamyl-Q tRNA(Asp) synthetase
LLGSTARQIYLQRLLGAAAPHYCHLPVITNREGQKFSKQTHAPALDSARAAHNLLLALRFLGQAAPPADAGVREILSIATHNWKPGAVPAQMSVPASFLGI